MKKTYLQTGLVCGLSVAAIVWVTPALSYDYVSSHCNQDVECINFTLNGKAGPDPGSRDSNDVGWHMDRLELHINANQCEVQLTSGGTKIINTSTNADKIFKVDSASTEFSKTWRVPTGCPYKLHARHERNSWGAKDDIFWYQIDAVTTKTDVCISWDFRVKVLGSC